MTVIDGAFADPVEAARSAGLRYVRDDRPGYRRRRHGRGFCYYDCDGEPIRDARRLRRLRALAIPPAWEQVWICPMPTATSRPRAATPAAASSTATTPRWREVRDATKFGRMLAFGAALPRCAQRVDATSRCAGCRARRCSPRWSACSTTTLIRVGNEEYARAQRAPSALTTLRDRHVEVDGARCASGSAARAASSTRSSSPTAAWRASSSAARSCPARSCSSTSTRTASRATSSPTT